MLFIRVKKYDDSDDLRTCLIPLADIANHVSITHEANIRTIGFISSSNLFLLETTDASCAVNDELCLNYNELSNWQLLLYYGFTIPNNPFDTVVIDLPSKKEQDTYEMEMKKMILMSMGEQQYGFNMEQEFNMTSKQIISDELMASMRLLVMTEQELNDYDISNLSKLLTTMVSIENERNVLSELENLFEEMKTVAYTTSLDDNVKRLNDEDTRLCDEER
ncbi:unnamed protein product, partial [Didymodactylos carnosus]